jgi:hypothetical protein
LYSTLQQQISANAAVEYVFSPGITLAPGGSYVAFINASSFFDGHVDQSYVSAVAGADRYTGGEFVYLNNGNDFSRVTVDDWTKTWTDTSGSTAKLNYDLSFEARFSSPGLSGGDPGTRVGDNEFGTFSLLGATLFGFGLLRRKVA